MSIKIYHNPRCRKSRETLALIHEARIEPEIIEYLKTPPSKTELDQILTYLDMEPSDIVRKGEKIYKELDLKNKELSREDYIQTLIENPIMIERPIVVNGTKAILGRPPENVNALL